MMPGTNPFFTATTGYSGEQQLIDSLVIEQIGIYGIDLMYMPRENVNLDRLLHEATKDVFSLAMSIPMYIKSFDGYDNSIEILSKFGVRSSDELTLVMSRSQWSTYYAPYVKSFYNAKDGRPLTADNDFLEGETSRRPKEGDIIYFPYDGGMFEVKYVQFDQPFFQLGKGYIYELQCEKFEYSGEDFTTGIPEIDTSSNRSAFPEVQFNMLEGGISNFEFGEKVRIFNLSNISFSDISTDAGDPILTEDLKFIYPDNLDVFQLYDDAGLIRRVPYVEATVAKWNGSTYKLDIDNLSDYDPERIDLQSGNVNVNVFDSVLVVGQESGASWTSSTVQSKPVPFNDAADIQEEFNKIKVYDTQDLPPFGFY
jgi:hypothetical protein